MVITLIIFCTVVTGIAGMQDIKKVGPGRRKSSPLLRGGFHTSALARTADGESGALVNMIGNGVASIVIASSEKELDRASLRKNLAQ